MLYVYSTGAMIAAYFLLRSVNCWYWKIDERMELQRETNRLLQQLINNTSKPAAKVENIFFTKENQTDLNNPDDFNALLEKMSK